MRNTQNNNNPRPLKDALNRPVYTDRQYSKFSRPQPSAVTENKQINKAKPPKKRRKKINWFRVIVLGLAGVLIISVLIIILRSCTNGENDSATSENPSDSATTTPAPTPTPQNNLKSGSDLLDSLWDFH